MKNILVPIGNNDHATNTLQYAIDFAQAFEAKIYLVHVYSSPKISGSILNVDQIMERDSKSILKDHLAKVDKKNVEIVTSTLKGYSIIDTLKQLNRLLNIDLIIASTKNDSADETIFVGKITGNIIKDTKVPVLIVPSKVSFKPMKKILMTIKSGSINSVSTLDLLIKIKQKFDSTINLLQVKTPKLEAKDMELNETLESHINKLVPTNNATVYQGVLEFLHEEDPDMICVIRRKRGFFKKLWEDDRVKKVDFESKIPLLVLKGMS
ncbi:universal stress protein [Lutimonas zeaxanthinifaciens]|uniref:universal stress protein n=1 Tax=Lutimonas zeaxanthinifaciens TaxID=3060215 RepID=UPI00265D197A|nr:universal stress protein [Lutimonas sp. YSD2104]WKK66128.1 universal stress protein [Lutimonas sp. YSD2104]